MLSRFVPVIATVLLATSAYAQVEFADVAEAITALTGKSTAASLAAVKYLAAHPNESLPDLFQIVEKQQNGWVYASGAIARSNDARALPFLTRVLADNLFPKEADGTRKRFGLGSKNGCSVMPNLLGSVLAERLGQLGDVRAIPTLREAVLQGDSAVQRSAYAALYALGDVSLDDLFLAGTRNVVVRGVIEEIGWRAIHSDVRFAVSVFDRIISDFADDPYKVASAHYWKIQCFEEGKRYDDALIEADEVMKFPEYESLTSQARQAQVRIRAKRSGVLGSHW